MRGRAPNGVSTVKLPILPISPKASTLYILGLAPCCSSSVQCCYKSTGSLLLKY